MKTIAPLCAAALLLGASMAVHAQSRPVYRCGNGIYQHQPCEGGAVLDSSDRRSGAQRAEARRATQTERETADRRKREQAAAAQAASAPAAVAAVAASAPAKKKP